MATHSFDIPHGPELDGEPQTRVTLKELNGQQYADCLEQSEKCVQVPVGVDAKGNVVTDFRLLPSPAKMGLLVLRTRIERIGDIPAPIPDSVWDKLSADDINTMLAESETFDDALSGVAQQGEP